MPRRPFRTLNRVGVVATVLAVVAVLAVGTVIWQSGAAGGPGVSSGSGGSGVVDTSWGPLSPADRDLLVTVRLTNLWEVSTAQHAQQRASSPEVKEVTGKIITEHTDLDQKVRDVAGKLGVPLPDAPDAQQVAWTQEITAATGPDYDRTVVQRLREADGYIVPLAMRARVGTRNDVIRVFAQDTLDHVTPHVGELEGTGLVDYSALPELPPSDQAAAPPRWRELVVPGLVLLTCLLVAVWLRSRLLGRRRSSGPVADSGGQVDDVADTGTAVERASHPVAEDAAAPVRDGLDDLGEGPRLSRR